MSDEQDNVISFETIKSDNKPTETESDEKVQDISKEQACQEVLEKVASLEPTNLVVIGFTEDGRGFIMDSTRNPSNTSYMTDMAKAMLFNS